MRARARVISGGNNRKRYTSSLSWRRQAALDGGMERDNPAQPARPPACVRARAFHSVSDKTLSCFLMRTVNFPLYIRPFLKFNLVFNIFAIIFCDLSIKIRFIANRSTLKAVNPAGGRARALLGVCVDLVETRSDSSITASVTRNQEESTHTHTHTQ